jgi:hypothetical protein
LNAATISQQAQPAGAQIKLGPIPSGLWAISAQLSVLIVMAHGFYCFTFRNWSVRKDISMIDIVSYNNQELDPLFSFFV